jgi:large-conductance mechanosensitive channel
MAARTRKRTVDQTRALTAGTTVRMEVPQSSRQRPTRTKQVAAVIVDSDINPVSGFVSFLREHAIVGLAIGFVIGTQVQGVVKQLIASFIDPLFKLLLGQALSQRTFTAHWHTRAASFGWGAFVYGLLDFLFVLATIYVVVKVLNLDKLDKPAK